MYLSKHRQILEEDNINIPGIILFGHNLSSRATLPLDMHTHEDCIEIVVIIKGSEFYYVEEKIFELSGGDVFISFVNQPHMSGNSAQGVCEFIWFQIKPSIYENFLGLSKINGDLIRQQLESINVHVIKMDSEAIDFLKKSFHSFLESKLDNRLYAQSLFVSFLSKLFLTQNVDSKGDASMQYVVKYIDEHILSFITIEELCSECNISLSGFKHKFKKYIGETPRDYINSRKIVRAKELLKSGKNITETAMILSFNTSDYFSVVFKKYTNCTPSQYIFKARA